MDIWKGLLLLTVFFLLYGIVGGIECGSIELPF